MWAWNFLKFKLISVAQYLQQRKLCRPSVTKILTLKLTIVNLKSENVNYK